MRVLLSTGSLPRCMASLASRLTTERAIASTLESNLLDGFEICASLSSLQAVSHGDSVSQLTAHHLTVNSARASRLIQAALARSTSLHLPNLADLSDDDCLAVSRAVARITTEIPLSHCVMHMDGVSLDRIALFLSSFPSNVVLSFENSDPHKANLQSLRECQVVLDRFPRLGLTLDICHWLEADARTLSLRRFLNDYSDRITALHFSVPRSRLAETTYPSDVDTHYMISNSDCSVPEFLFEALPAAVPVVLEGVVPPAAPHLLLRECRAVHSLRYVASRRAAIASLTLSETP